MYTGTHGRWLYGTLKHLALSSAPIRCYPNQVAWCAPYKSTAGVYSSARGKFFMALLEGNRVYGYPGHAHSLEMLRSAVRQDHAGLENAGLCSMRAITALRKGLC